MQHSEQPESLDKQSPPSRHVMSDPTEEATSFHPALGRRLRHLT